MMLSSTVCAIGVLHLISYSYQVIPEHYESAALHCIVTGQQHLFKLVAHRFR